MTYKLNAITLRHGAETHLDGISLALPQSGVVTLIGRTLAGKTSLLKIIAGLIAPTSGSIDADGQNLLAIPAWQRRVGMVYQQFVNYPHLSVRDNITFPLHREKLEPRVIAQKLNYVTELLGLGPMLDRRPSELSGGQQQRVALARSLVKNSDFLLLDEPLVNLDYKLREQLRDEFRRIFHTSTDRLVIYATTEPVEAMIMQGQVAILHEGRLIQTGDYREVYRRPANVIAAAVFNDPPMNLLQGAISDGQVHISGMTPLAVPQHLQALAPASYTFGIRAQDVELGGHGLRGQVGLAEINGSTTVLHLDTPAGPAVLEKAGVHPRQIGEAVGLRLPGERLFAFDATTGALKAAPLAD